MKQLRLSSERGHVDAGWLDSRHTFSFGSYYDPAHMSFGPLRVINEDHIAPGGGFPPHPHRDMEIVTYVVQGALAHRDSLGNGSEIRPGDVQHMTAGTGIRHSEYNASDSEPVWLLQIWIEPEAQNFTPGYQQIHFEPAELRNRLRLVAARDGRDGSVKLHQDVDLYAARLDSGERVELPARPDRRRWIQVIEGEVRVGDTTLRAGDGLGIVDDGVLTIDSSGASHLLAFDMADV
jgi:redox-sensitive bicupin YhaK (pirin superfamily)